MIRENLSFFSWRTGESTALPFSYGRRCANGNGFAERAWAAPSSRPLRVVICHYKDDAQAGGSLRVGQAIANHVSPTEIEGHLLFTYGNAGPVAAASRVKCHYPQVEGRWDVCGWWRVRRFIQELQPDIVHFQDPLFILRAFLSDLPLVRVTHCHGRPLFPPETITQKLAVHWQRQTTDLFVCINPSAAHTLVQFKLATPEQCQVVPNAVNVAILQDCPNQKTARKNLGVPENAKILGMVGRVIQTKGFPDLFQIVKKLPNCWHAVVFGDGQDRPHLEQQVQQIGLAKRIHFVGLLADVRPAYAAMDALIFLSIHEPFGLILAEAMACHVPVFGLHGLGEYRELDPPLVDDTVATFFERENPHRFLNPSEWSIPESDYILERLCEAICKLETDSVTVRQKTEAAFGRVQQHYDVQVQAAQMTEIYQKLSALQRGGLA